MPSQPREPLYHNRVSAAFQLKLKLLNYAEALPKKSRDIKWNHQTSTIHYSLKDIANLMRDKANGGWVQSNP